MIYFGELKLGTLAGLRLIASHNDWDTFQLYETEERVAWLTYRLQPIEDRADYFPHGKWATIQRLQGMCEQAAKDAELAAWTPSPERGRL